MPYINSNSREDIRPYVNILADRINNEGELNYAITKLLLEYLDRLGCLRYTDINTLVGVLECAKMELYRRLAAPYEDEKIEENGDVY